MHSQCFPRQENLPCFRNIIQPTGLETQNLKIDRLPKNCSNLRHCSNQLLLAI